MRTRWEVRELSYRPEGGARDTVDGVSLGIAAGRMTALLGPNGAGKTTLLRLMLGVLMPSRGTIVFDGTNVDEWDRRAFARAGRE